MDLKELQDEVNERWVLQVGNPCHRSADLSHALIHMTKALGKLASACNDAQHERRALRHEEVARYLADMVICAARFGYDFVDLDAACVSRLAEKFPVKDQDRERKFMTDFEGRPMCANCHSPEFTHPGRICDTYVAMTLET
jgi:hypothetical protein